MTEVAAREMGLAVGTPVATSLIDAHAGGLGMIGVGLKNSNTFRNRLGECTWRSSECFLHDFQSSSEVRPYFIPYANAWLLFRVFYIHTNNRVKAPQSPSMNRENIFVPKSRDLWNKTYTQNVNERIVYFINFLLTNFWHFREVSDFIRLKFRP